MHFRVASSLIKVVAWDLGKVLLDFDYNRAVEVISTRSNSSPTQIKEIIFGSGLMERFERGQIDAYGFYEIVKCQIGYNGTIEELCRDLTDNFQPIYEMVRLLELFKTEGLVCVAFSNTNELSVKAISSYYEFWKFFDFAILSYKVKSMKPEPLMYEELERLTKVSPNQILYIDDIEQNVNAGLKRGWVAIHHVNYNSTISELLRRGILRQDFRVLG